MKLWVDDARTPPDESWVWVKTAADAVAALHTAPGWDVMSLDHDLGGEDTTRGIVIYLCEGHAPWPDEVLVHSQNPVGRDWLTGMIERYRP